MDPGTPRYRMYKLLNEVDEFTKRNSRKENKRTKGGDSMSWWIKNQCNECKKSAQCLDLTLFYNATSTIHTIGESRGHLGGGTVDLLCSNFEKKD